MSIKLELSLIFLFSGETGQPCIWTVFSPERPKVVSLYSPVKNADILKQRKADVNVQNDSVAKTRRVTDKECMATLNTCRFIISDAY